MATEPGGAGSGSPWGNEGEVAALSPLADGRAPISQEARLETLVDEEDIWRLATALSAAVAPEDVAVALAEEGASAAGASFSNMAMLEAGTNRVRVVHSSVLNRSIAARWAEFRVDDQTPLCDAIRSGLPVLLPSIEALGQRYPNLLADTLAASLSATASLPLHTPNGACLGAVGFGWPRPQAFGPTQLRRLDLIAQMAAQALDRAMLYERERGQPSAEERAEAHLLQEAFLPRVLPQTGTLGLAAAYLPAREAAMGGDWYDAFPVEGGLCLVIGDVAGHGLRSAALMAQLRNAVRAFADEDPAPARVLTRLNRMLCRLEPDETATAIVAVWNAASGTIIRSNAGHPPVLRCRVGETAFLPPRAGHLVLGVDPDWAYASEIKVLRPGTTLLFYTDGLVETRGRSVDEGMDDLRRFVESAPDLSPQALCDRVLEWRLGAARREDDMCLLAARLT
ncbi:MAG TPA: GAF domain-containing SpoIIE family protein phosphatase [Actinomycetota bacterium]|jgi:serine phosphatase RsbU (regulator of sigma subunit)|nr:GAF domain-containing SpoIIE family protein phosphatase [Actinomycetota bacterium]